MGQFATVRLLDAVVKLFIISMIAFWVLVILPPGNPATRFAGKSQDPAKIAAIEETFCFNKGNIRAYSCFMKMTLSGNFPSPSQGDVNIMPRAFQAIPVTAGLAGLAALLWVTAGVAAGAKGATQPGTGLDRGIMITALIGISFPSAWLALLMLKWFTADIAIFPAGGYVSIAEGGIFGWFWHLLLPAITLSIIFAGVYARMTRTNVRQSLHNEYVKTAIAKGLPRERVFIHHVLRTGLIPIVVLFGMDVAALLGGAIFTESIFGLPGLGGFLMQGIATFDFAILFVGTLIAATFVILSTTVVDMIQAMLDPRVRLA